jgi:homoserine dehydrogenase
MRADLALVGFGNVGRRFARLLDEQRERLHQQHDLDCRIVGIATRRHGLAYNAVGLDGPNAAAFVENGGIVSELSGSQTLPSGATSLDVVRGLSTSEAPLRVVVESTTLDIAAGQPAIDHVVAALSAGCDVITANKGPAAFAYQDLRHRARDAGLSFLFEGAVMDGVPVFNLTRETMPVVNVLSFRGVVNSTTNHILTALEDGEDFGPALARMQIAGIAEADPTLDVDGWDAAAKAAALANVLLDARITPHDVIREGVGPANATPAREAKARGMRLRLVVEGKRGQTPSVKLRTLPGGDLLAGLRGTANALVLTTDLLGEIAICQLGGGLTQTAYALLSDLVTVRRRRAAQPGEQLRRSP